VITVNSDVSTQVSVVDGANFSEHSESVLKTCTPHGWIDYHTKMRDN
jgi:hypothetical protein